MSDSFSESTCIASILFKKLTPQIRCIIADLLNFTQSYEYDDYFQEAYLACRQAVILYKKMNGDKSNRMQLPVFAHWHIKKRLYSMADTGEVVYQVYSPSGEYVDTLRNGELRKRKKSLEAQGFAFRSVNLRDGLYFTDEDGKEVEKPLAGIVATEYEYEEE